MDYKKNYMINENSKSSNQNDIYKKYCKYKLKYLQLKQTLKGGMDSVPSVSITDTATQNVRKILFNPADNVYETIAEAFEKPVVKIMEVIMGHYVVDPSETFEEAGIEDGARLAVTFVTVRQVMQDIVRLNDHLNVEKLMEYVDVDPDDASRVTGNLFLNRKRIRALPESIGSLTVDGMLALSNNELRTLPESFGSLTVNSTLTLFNNMLETLPESFGSLTIGNDLYLNNNMLETLPESFGSLNMRNKDDDHQIHLYGNPVARTEPSFPGLNILNYNSETGDDYDSDDYYRR